METIQKLLKYSLILLLGVLISCERQKEPKPVNQQQLVIALY